MKRPLGLGFAFMLAGCASTASSSIRWEPILAWQGESPIERLKAGRPDASDPAMQVVSVDQGGTVALVHFEGEKPRAEILLKNDGGLTGLCIADIDPSIPGEEIYAGGGHEMAAWPPKPGDGGVVLQIVPGPGGPRVRRIFEGEAYVHAMDRYGAGQLLVTDYVGRVFLLTPAPGDGPWPSKLLYSDPPSKDPEVPKIKDIAVLRDPSGAAAHEALVVMKTGRAVYIDIDRPEGARLVHEEPGGLSRAEANADGGAFVTGYTGRVLRFVRDGLGFRVDPIHLEGPDSGLRGVVQGRFPVAAGDAPLAIFGYMQVCRVLTPTFGAWDAVSIFRDDGKGHALLAADLFPGNDADELVLAGFGNRITVLTVRRGR